ncbi:D-arabinitol 2-dehydrogenase [Clavispora lusitaniae ATCC 42720]|uniref:D-arabinitol 2-dehydrogenase n=1 Tax=Clavispora lusitaniae (strain ATCC 42720) TaxID=306902 RepID=C4XWQ8_CLAL4|nr:D-arabinitol 2-dehydrogenase [Clavispora lusitaniae ATCC 42720]EEQ36258.1 D-arabinitol 2-dehydrogenase [Clavispora lusitaniae ATCC 42720]
MYIKHSGGPLYQSLRAQDFFFWFSILIRYFSPLPALVATIDNQIVACCVGGCRFGSQVQDGSHKLLWISHALHWDLALPCLLHFCVARNDVFRQRRKDVAWRQGVDTDVVLGPFTGQRAHQVDHARLGHVVHTLRLWVVDNGAGHGANQDDGATQVVLDQRFGESSGHVERAQAVDTHDTLGIERWVVLGREVLTVASSVDQQVGDFAVGLVDLGKGGGHRLGITNVAGPGRNHSHRRSFVALQSGLGPRQNTFGCSLCAFQVDIDQRDIGASGNKSTRDHVAHSAGAASKNRQSSVQTEVGNNVFV